jgi:DNA-binding transcriptional MocR family regulator
MLPPLQLDPQAAEPLYRQLHRQLRELILSGALQRGERIPPTRELAAALGVNRATVAAAYELLEQEGLIRGHVGRGSFVAGGQAGAGLDWEKRLGPAAGELRSWGAGARISFVSARPEDSLLPVEEFRSSCLEVLESGEAARLLQLGSPYGYAPLREWILEQARAEGTAQAGDDVMVTSGCQQALDLLERVLARPGEAVAVEDPVYPGLRDVFLRGGARVVGVPVGRGGMDLAALARTMEREPVTAIAVTPNFQNPTGETMALEARRELLRLAQRARVAVIENDIYGALRYRGEDLPSLKQLDEAGLVIQVRSFSKLAMPGLRVGWVVAPRAVVRRLAECKQTADLHSDHLSQAVLLRFAASGRLEAHRRRLIEAGRARLEAVLEACARHLPPGSQHTRPEGGANLWVRLPEPLDAERLLAKAEEAGVSYLPGRLFAVQRAETAGLRLSFAGLAPERIAEGLEILGRIFRAEWRKQRAAEAAGLAPAIV